MNTKQSDVEMLKAEVEYMFGRKIMSSRDCIELSDLVNKKTGLTINSNTLRRCFRLIKSDYPPSTGTLNILAVFCGSLSFDDLVVYKKSTGEITTGETAALLKYLEVVFQNVSVPNIEAPTFIKLVHTTIDFLNQNLAVAYEFQKIIVKTSNAKRFYFEHFVNIDKLNSFYGNGLRYYLSENKELDAQIFGHALLTFRYWLKMDMKGLQANHKKLVDYKITADIPLFICVRYFAARLFFAEATGLDATEILQEASAFYNNAKALNESDEALGCFALDFSEALILTNHYKEALAYITEGLNGNLQEKQAVNISTYKNFKLYQAIVLTKLGNQEMGAAIFDQVSPLDFSFIKKDFQTIFYFSLGITLNKLKPTQVSVDFLIEETGFTKMRNLLAVA